MHHFFGMVEASVDLKTIYTAGETVLGDKNGDLTIYSLPTKFPLSFLRTLCFHSLKEPLSSKLPES